MFMGFFPTDLSDFFLFGHLTFRPQKQDEQVNREGNKIFLEPYGALVSLRKVFRRH